MYVLDRTAIIMSACGFLSGLLLARALQLEPESAWTLPYFCTCAIDVGYRLRGYQRATSSGFRSSLKRRLFEASYGGTVAWVIPLWVASAVLWVVF